MDRLQITRSQLRAHNIRITGYVREVVECGHEPGVLSGASLSGKAKTYGSSYARTRERLAKAVAAGGRALSGLSLTGSRRWARVWVNARGEPVQLELV